VSSAARDGAKHHGHLDLDDIERGEVSRCGLRLRRGDGRFQLAGDADEELLEHLRAQDEATTRTLDLQDRSRSCFSGESASNR
jgi:hypothetical protein